MGRGQVDVGHVVLVGDRPDDMEGALSFLAGTGVALVITSGGLGPTADDLTAAVQIAAELQVPITARGGGTSLSGQSIGPGIVLDCSKYLDQVGEVDVTGRRVRVQPGVVLDQLNKAVGKYGLQFGPDVATASRATRAATGVWAWTTS